MAQYRFVDDGSGFLAEEIDPLVVSADPNFRPSDVEIGADGAYALVESPHLKRLKRLNVYNIECGGQAEDCLRERFGEEIVEV